MNKRFWVGSFVMGCSLVLAASLACAGTITLLSASPDGIAGNNVSRGPCVSNDGRIVIFASYATNIGTTPPSGYFDIFIRNMETSENIETPFHPIHWTLSGNGKFLVFSTRNALLAEDNDSNNDVYVYDLEKNILELVGCDIPNIYKSNSGMYADISYDGRYVSFESDCHYNDKSLRSAVFVYDRVQDELKLITEYGHYTGMSGDGRYVLTDYYVYYQEPYPSYVKSGVAIFDVETGTSDNYVHSYVPAGGMTGTINISRDGRFFPYTAQDENGIYNVFIKDRQTGEVEKVTVTHDGSPTNGNSGTMGLDISDDGRFIVFDSSASNLIHENLSQSKSRLYVYDRSTKHIELITRNTLGEPADYYGRYPAISGNGSIIVFDNLDRNGNSLTENDSNGFFDVFAYYSSSDTIPPYVEINATPNRLWPPNKKYADVLIDGSATDDSGQVSIAITVTDEYGEMIDMPVSGFGSTIQLEAWREGSDLDGRTYTITAVASDAAGNQATATTEVVVPHDMRDKKEN